MFISLELDWSYFFVKISFLCIYYIFFEVTSKGTLYCTALISEFIDQQFRINLPQLHLHATLKIQNDFYRSPGYRIPWGVGMLKNPFFLIIRISDTIRIQVRIIRILKSIPNWFLICLEIWAFCWIFITKL